MHTSGRHYLIRNNPHCGVFELLDPMIHPKSTTAGFFKARKKPSKPGGQHPILSTQAEISFSFFPLKIPYPTRRWIDASVDYRSPHPASVDAFPPHFTCAVPRTRERIAPNSNSKADHPSCFGFGDGEAIPLPRVGSPIRSRSISGRRRAFEMQHAKCPKKVAPRSLMDKVETLDKKTYPWTKIHRLRVSLTPDRCRCYETSRPQGIPTCPAAKPRVRPWPRFTTEFCFNRDTQDSYMLESPPFISFSVISPYLAAITKSKHASRQLNEAQRCSMCVPLR